MQLLPTRVASRVGWLACLVGLASAGRQQSEASVEELERQLRQGLSSNDEAAVIASAAALGERGAGAIPWLWHAIEFDHPERTTAVRGAAVKALRRIGHRACLRLPDAGRWLACEGWSPREPLAESLSDWLELIEHPVEEWRALAARELAKRHPEAIESVIARLKDPDPDTRVHAAAAAGAFSRARVPSRSGAYRVLPKPVAPLVACLEADDPRLRVQACMSLGRMLPDSARALVDASRHADPRVRREALYGLALGLDARWAVSPVPDVSLNGYRGLWSPDWPLAGSELVQSESIDLLAGGLEDPAPGNRILILTILAKIGRGTPAAVEHVQQARGDPHAGVRAWAEYTLRRLDPSDALALEDLLAGPDARSPSTRAPGERLAELVRALDAGPEFEPETGPWGLEFPAAGSRNPRYEAALELARRAPSAHPGRVLAVVERHVRTLIAIATDFPAFFEAKELLGAVGPVALPQVGGGWLMGFWDLRGIIYLGADVLGEVLVGIGPRSLPVLSLGLESPEYYLEAPSLLSRVPGAAEVVGPAWIGAMRLPRTAPHDTWRLQHWESIPSRDNPEQRNAFELACRQMGPGLVPWLLDALQDERALVRARACRGLGALEVASSAVVEALTRALQDDQGHVRFAAADALLGLQAIEADLAQRCREMLAELGERP